VRSVREVERCAECGFDGAQWTEAAALVELAGLGERWTAAIAELSADDLGRRPVATMWSIAEYVDHVREVLFGMRFILDVAVDSPGTDLGASPQPAFTETPRPVDVTAALGGVVRESAALRKRLLELSPEEWSAEVTFDDAPHDARWICRHAVHDATHHLGDVRRLAAAL
jgi:hypothetical protein